MKVYQPLLLAYLAMSTAAAQKFLDSIGKTITKEVSDIKQPIDEAITFIGNSQCANVKRIIGVQYDQVDGKKEPDLNQLTLNYISKVINVTFNINAAAKLIPEARDYNPHQKLIIFIHGFTDDPTKDSFKTIRDAFLKTGEYNVLALDASSLIRWLYLRSTTYVRFTGEKLGEVLAAMVETGLNPSVIHMIGHSLGSHIAGFTGKTFTNITGRQIGRISSLDPAGPCFSDIDPELRLKASDAKFVDVIHTDAGVYGLKEAVGHADFYVNGGSQQPNCLFQTCSHSRVWLLYAESVVTPDAFPAVECKDRDYDLFKKGQCGNKTTLMGYSCKPDTRGIFHLQTGEDSPYGLGTEGLRYRNTDGIVGNVKNIAKGFLG